MWQQSRIAAIAVFIATALMQSSAAGAEAERILRVEYQDSRLSVEARNVTLPEVLRAMADEVRFDFQEDGRVRPPVSMISFQGVTVEEALTKLLVGENYAIGYRPVPDQPGHHVIARVILAGLPSALGSERSDEGCARDLFGVAEGGDSALPGFGGGAEASEDANNEIMLERMPEFKKRLQEWRDSLKNRSPDDQVEPSESEQVLQQRHEEEVEQVRQLLEDWRTTIKQRQEVDQEGPSEDQEALRERHEQAAEQARQLLQNWQGTIPIPSESSQGAPAE